MILGFDTIKKITCGAHLVEEVDGAFRFYKCTEKQHQAWLGHSQTLGDRAVTTTGVRLDFKTNSSSVSFETVSGGSFELKINGNLRCKLAQGKHTVALTNERKDALDCARITLVFPSHSVGSIKNVEVDDGAYVEPVCYDKRFLFIGDSITQGYNSSYHVASYAWRVIDYYDADAIINGIGGAFYAADTFDVPAFDPDVIFIAYGTNDFGRGGVTMDEKREEICSYLDLVKENYADKKVIVISPIYRCTADGTPMSAEFDAFRLYIENETEKRGFNAISGLSLVPPIKEMYADGTLHPNDLGFAYYAESLLRKIKDII